MLGVQARIFDSAFFEVSGGGLKNVEHRHFVIRRNVEGFRCAIFKVTPRDPSTALRSGQDDVSSSARCLTIARPDRQLAMLRSSPRARLPYTGPSCRE